MKVLVAGSGGQLGNSLVNQKTRGIEWFGFTRQEMDITSLCQISDKVNLIRPDLIINCSAYTAVDLAESRHDQAWRVNCDGVTHLAEIARQWDIPFIHISTDYVFDGFKSESYLETDQPSPLNFYGKSKLAGEQAALDAFNKVLILRTSWVFSEQDGNFFTTMLKLGLTKQHLKVVDDQKAGPTPVKLLSSIILQLLSLYQQQSTLPWGLYHYCGEPFVNRFEFVEFLMNDMLNKGMLHSLPELEAVDSSIFPTPAARPENSCLNTGKLKALLGRLDNDWRPEVQQLLAIKAHQLTSSELEGKYETL